MTLDKAIELLQMDIDNPGSVAIEDVNDAEQLGIEALKRHKEMSALVPAMPYPLLPGETPENYHPNTDAILKKLQESPLGKKPEA